jgi:hypothetical protein
MKMAMNIQNTLIGKINGIKKFFIKG